MSFYSIRPCPFCANEQLVVATVNDESTWARAVVCLECGASGPRAVQSDPPGHAEFMWNQRFGADN